MYRGFLGGNRLYVTDPKALAHILVTKPVSPDYSPPDIPIYTLKYCADDTLPVRIPKTYPNETSSSSGSRRGRPIRRRRPA